MWRAVEKAVDGITGSVIIEMCDDQAVVLVF
jgi:hypothetical protein